jgi:hypothetical protein
LYLSWPGARPAHVRAAACAVDVTPAAVAGTHVVALGARLSFQFHPTFDRLQPRTGSINPLLPIDDVWHQLRPACSFSRWQ